MPTYAYACTACDHRFEAQQAFTDASLTECPECSGRLRKLFNAVGIVFKGSGFYRTDSRGSGKGSADLASSGSNGSASSDKSGGSSDKSSTSDKGGSDKAAASGGGSGKSTGSAEKGGSSGASTPAKAGSSSSGSGSAA